MGDPVSPPCDGSEEMSFHGFEAMRIIAAIRLGFEAVLSPSFAWASE
jgi:hypothetical protein